MYHVDGVLFVCWHNLSQLHVHRDVLDCGTRNDAYAYVNLLATPLRNITAGAEAGKQSRAVGHRAGPMLRRGS